MAEHPFTTENHTARRVSHCLLVIASFCLLGNALLNSPFAFSERQKSDISPLGYLVWALGLGANFPTPRGVEIRNLIFYSGAALLLLVTGFALATSRGLLRRPNVDLFDLRARSASPYFWWALMLLIAVLTSAFSHAPDVCKGQVIIHIIHFAWWLPLAILLRREHVRPLAIMLTVAIGLTAVVGVWYYLARGLAGGRLEYPMGNSIWLGACLLPAIFIASSLAFTVRIPRLTVTGSESKVARRNNRISVIALCFAVIACGLALFFTKSRSSFVGLLAASFFVVYMLLPRARIMVTVLALAAGLFGIWYMQGLRTTGEMGTRSHSIRTRLNYEWPYAIRLFMEKPVGGWGDGCYTMLAGQLAREDQLEDPSTMSFDEKSWPANAHNEYLELLADIGIAGAGAFILALVVTIIAAIRYCDIHRVDADPYIMRDRFLAIGLASALFGMMVDEAGNVALRHPGFPPIFLTVWAALWTLIRSNHRTLVSVEMTPPAGSGAVRFAGVLMAAIALVLGYYGVQDWRGARARFDSGSELEEGQFKSAQRSADFAYAALLDPLQKLFAGVIGLEARVQEFAARMADPQRTPAQDDLDFARDAIVRLNVLWGKAPRFLRLSHIDWQLLRGLSHAHQRRGETEISRQYYGNYLDALEQNRRDEPFSLEIVQRLWQDNMIVPPVDRLRWLRCTLRREPITPSFVSLIRNLLDMPTARNAIGDLINLAEADRPRSPFEWSDELSPETFRLAALVTSLSWKFVDAANYAKKADEMYAKAGPRLFAAHAEAVLEYVQYRFRSAPTTEPDTLLAELQRGFRLLAGPVPSGEPLPGTFGYTRLNILLANGREGEAVEQLQGLDQHGDLPETRRLAYAYIDLANQFAGAPTQNGLALTWLDKAVDLQATLPEAFWLRTRILLLEGREDEAFVAAGRFIELTPDHQAAYAALHQIESEQHGPRFWAHLRASYTGFPMSETAPVSTSQPSSAE